MEKIDNNLLLVADTFIFLQQVFFPSVIGAIINTRDDI
jgi:hypothetical protein|tara:strand:+ start:421 stop:534 length:114 start_codon:yes stop_codon:yes gene_type:complete